MSDLLTVVKAYAMHPFKLIGLVLLGLANSASAIAAVGHADDVDPRTGTCGDGHTFPGATAPFGMIQLSSDTAMADFKHAYRSAAGCQYGGRSIMGFSIMGFSHTHFCGPDYSVTASRWMTRTLTLAA